MKIITHFPSIHKEIKREAQRRLRETQLLENKNSSMIIEGGEDAKELQEAFGTPLQSPPPEISKFVYEREGGSGPETGNVVRLPPIGA